MSKCPKMCTKIVIRRLPPDFSFEQLKEQVSPLVNYNYFYFEKAGKIHGNNNFSRAYINFVDLSEMYTFKEKYDSYVFLDSKGVEYPAVVEYAPFQKIPNNRINQKFDSKCGTIHKNEYYTNYVKNVKCNNEKKVERPAYDIYLNNHSDKSEIITPLLKYISEHKSDPIKYRSCTKNRDINQKHDNCLVFVNSSIKKKPKFKISETYIGM